MLLTSDPAVDQTRAAHAGFAATLTKPVRSAQLRTVLADLAAAQSLEEEPARRGRILVVDENPTNQLITSGMVEYLGYNASVAADEVEALIALARVRYDAVLIDCRLPVRGELRTAQEIRRFHGAGDRVPIIAMTAAENGEHLADLRDAGIDDHLTRPIALESLSTVLSPLDQRALTLLTRPSRARACAATARSSTPRASSSGRSVARSRWKP